MSSKKYVIHNNDIKKIAQIAQIAISSPKWRWEDIKASDQEGERVRHIINLICIDSNEGKYNIIHPTPLTMLPFVVSAYINKRAHIKLPGYSTMISGKLQKNDVSFFIETKYQTIEFEISDIDKITQLLEDSVWLGLK